MAENTHLGQALQHAICAFRDTKGLSQRDLAIRSGLTRQYISMVERQKRLPGLDTLIALSQGLGIPLAELCGEIERLLQHYQVHRPQSKTESPDLSIAADSGRVGWKTAKEKAKPPKKSPPR
jgi:transcriptional regulator with XRE-family HTH domain